MKKNFWPPFFWGFFICAIYDLQKIIPNTGRLYFLALYLIPLILFVLKKINLAELGIKLGNPLEGLIIAFILPMALFFRYKFMGKFWSFSPAWQVFIIGSVGEEFFYRGYLQGQFDKHFGVNLSLFLTNFFFMLIHIVKGYSFLPALMIFLIGIYFSYGRHPKGGNSLLWSSISHSLYNIIISSFHL